MKIRRETPIPTRSSDSTQAEQIYKAAARHISHGKGVLSTVPVELRVGGFPAGISSHFLHSLLPGFNGYGEQTVKIQSHIGYDGNVPSEGNVMDISFRGIEKDGVRRKHLTELVFSVLRDGNSMSIERTIVPRMLVGELQLNSPRSPEVEDYIVSGQETIGPDYIDPEDLERELGFRIVSYPEAEEVLETISRVRR